MIKKGRYIHSKTGNYYRVIGLARHSETNEEMVIYETLYDNPVSKIWVRPAKMFSEKVVVDGKKVSRFKFVSKD